jgi:MATE family multidrug resistance protein
VTAARGETRTIARHAGTVLVGQLAAMAFGVTDTIVAGRYAENALAALSVGAAIFISVYVSLMGVMQALLPVWAELHGAQRTAEIGRSARQALYLCALATVLGMAVLLFPGALLRATQVPAGMRDDVEAYLAVLAFALAPALLFRLFSTLNQSLGKPQLVTWLQLASLLLKLPLSIWLAFGGAGMPALGLVGCACATLVVNWTMVLLALYLLRTQEHYRAYRFWQRIEAPDWRQIGQFARLGVPGGLAVLVEVTSFTLMALFIARMGTAAAAAHQIASNLTAVAYMAPLSLAIATSARVSFWLGAADPAQARRACRRGLVLTADGPADRDADGHATRGTGIGLFRQSRGAGAGRQPAARDRGLPRGRRAAGAVRIRAALLPRGGGAAGDLLHAAVGPRAGRQLPARLSWTRAVGADAFADGLLGDEHRGALPDCGAVPAPVAARARLLPIEAQEFNNILASRTRPAGNTSTKRDPLPTVLSTRNSAPCRCTTCLTMASPRPVPPVSRERLRSMR